MRSSDRVAPPPSTPAAALSRLGALAVSLALLACEKPQGAAPDAASSAPLPASSAAPSASAERPRTPVEAGAPTMPERPIPRPQTTVGAGMPIDVQQKAIAYMVAMRAPRPDDPSADPAYADELAQKLRPIVASVDTGSDKRLNRVEVAGGGRQVDLLMAGGCDEKTPARAVVQRAGVPLATLASRGIFVVRCNDARIQCLQSTRDPNDVLCTTAPRHK